MIKLPYVNEEDYNEEEEQYISDLELAKNAIINIIGRPKLSFQTKLRKIIRINNPEALSELFNSGYFENIPDLILGYLFQDGWEGNLPLQDILERFNYVKLIDIIEDTRILEVIARLHEDQNPSDEIWLSSNRRYTTLASRKLAQLKSGKKVKSK